MNVTRVPNSRLFVVANNIESFVPGYDVRQSDPDMAAREGVGNCVAKAVIAAVALEHYGFMGGASPALVWNKHTHPAIVMNMMGNKKKLNGHASLLATNCLSTNITHLSFNTLGKATKDWEMHDFNETANCAKVEEGEIVATEYGKAMGYVIADWHEGGKLYYEALGVNDSVFHRIGRSAMSDTIMDSLHSRDLISTFDLQLSN